MEQLEIEGIAEGVLTEAKQVDEDLPKLAALVHALLGRNSVAYARSLPGDAALVRIYDSYRIYVRRGLPVERRSFAVAHEIAEWWLRVREGYGGPDLEEAANGVAAAIMTPRRAFRRAVRALGTDLAELAAAFRTTETFIALREAEVEGMPRAVVSTAAVRVRGPSEWVWPDERTLRRWARDGAPGVRSIRLTDDPKRVVIDPDHLEVG